MGLHFKNTLNESEQEIHESHSKFIDNIVNMLAEKDAIIASLQMEVELLKKQLENK